VARVSQEELLERLVARSGTILVLGGIDTGKTSFGLSLAEAARASGISAAYVDADIGQSTIGPPACVGLKFLSDLEGVDRDSVTAADELAFVGSMSPSGNLLSLVSGTGRLVAEAREAGAGLIVVDTTGLISGTQAELLKYHKLQVVRPDAVVGFQRGEELEPLLGIVSRFFPTDVTALKVHGAVKERSAEERMAYREERFASYFAGPLQRWRVKTTVFMPTIPFELDPQRLHGLLVGLEDGKGSCLGMGILEYDSPEGILRMVSPVSEGATGLLLGSIRITTGGKLLGTVSHSALFGSQ
jgi:polynucleotide 5'-kinase involved in rRNA processing